MWLNTTKKVLSIMERLPEDNSKILDSYINSFSSQSAQDILTNALSAEDPVSYLTKTSKRIKLVTPVNAVNYEILSRRIKGIVIDTKKDLNSLRDAIRKKDPSAFQFLPPDIRILLKTNGATIQDDPFYILTDDRKLVMPFIATNDEFRRIDDELEAIGNYVLQKLSPANLKLTYSNPRGAQQNSFNEFCWLAFSPTLGMKNTVHQVLKVNSQGYEALLHIGIDLYKKVKKKLEPLPFHFEESDFLMKKFSDLDGAILYLQSKNDLCVELNKLFEDDQFDPTQLKYDYVAEEVDSYEEGEEKLVLHKNRERKSKIVVDAKKRFLEKNGTLYCEKCRFNFESAYGDLGKGYIEAHHLKPISQMQSGDKTSIDDLQMLCANCHRMEHRRISQSK